MRSALSIVVAFMLSCGARHDIVEDYIRNACYDGTLFYQWCSYDEQGDDESGTYHQCSSGAEHTEKCSRSGKFCREYEAYGAELVACVEDWIDYD